MKASPAENEPESRPEAAQRFTYPSGSRPLDGYTIKRGVGRGGFGEVYFAISDAGKEVALKLIRRNLDVEIRGVKQCLNLKHQNLVALYDIRGDEMDDRWVVMEYVSGASLEDVIDQHPEGMPEDLLLFWFTGIAQGVAYLHDHGIVHRDLKPANIFMDEGVVKIGDYGLSKFISCSRRSGQTESVGTVHYMAPEIANGRYGKEIDTYALGIILFEMLTGQVPFQGESVGEVLMKHLTAEPDLAKLTEPYRGIVQVAMTKDPELRLQSVSEMLARLPGAKDKREPYIPPKKASADSPKISKEAFQPPEPKRGVKALLRDGEEPIAAAVVDGWNSLIESVEPFHPVAKAIGLFMFIMLAIATSWLWFPAAVVLGGLYLVYRFVRPFFISSVVHPGKSNNNVDSNSVNLQELTATKKHPGAPIEVESKQARRHYARRRRQSWHQQLQEHVAARSLRDRFTELVGSMVIAAVIASLFSIVGVAFSSNNVDFAQYLALVIITTVGSWAVMIPTKFAEGQIEDQAPMRFTLLIAGALVGLVAWLVAAGLQIEIPTGTDITPYDTLASELLSREWNHGLVQQYRSGTVKLTMPVSVAYFALLFVLPRWWRLAEYSRNSRVSLWWVAVSMFAGFAITFLWWFPQPFGLMTAGIIAVTIQLASPWMPPSYRRRLAEQGA